MIGNDYTTELFSGPSDAFIGKLFEGNGKRSFQNKDSLKIFKIQKY